MPCSVVNLSKLKLATLCIFCTASASSKRWLRGLLSVVMCSLMFVVYTHLPGLSSSNMSSKTRVGETQYFGVTMAICASSASMVNVMSLMIVLPALSRALMWSCLSPSR